MKDQNLPCELTFQLTNNNYPPSTYSLFSTCKGSSFFQTHNWQKIYFFKVFMLFFCWIQNLPFNMKFLFCSFNLRLQLHDHAKCRCILVVWSNTPFLILCFLLLKHLLGILVGWIGWIWVEWIFEPPTGIHCSPLWEYHASNVIHQRKCLCANMKHFSHIVTEKTLHLY